ncbi:hypothetical protein CDD83_9562 [Cordyceps sp. RAO-2017]|nr:hypothetical protein CDD83_9562 [Cordyceps sp. RAO-2017]
MHDQQLLGRAAQWELQRHRLPARARACGWVAGQPVSCREAASWRPSPAQPSLDSPGADASRGFKPEVVCPDDLLPVIRPQAGPGPFLSSSAASSPLLPLSSLLFPPSCQASAAARAYTHVPLSVSVHVSQCL